MPVTSWGTIKVPKSLLEKVDKLAKVEKVPRHVIIAKAINLYLGHEQNVGGTKYLKGKRHSRGMWYAWKLMLSYAEFRVAIKYRKCFPHTVLEKMIRTFSDTLSQVMIRTKAITKEEAKQILALAKEWMTTQDNRTLYHLNDIIRDVFYRVLGGR